MADINEGSDNIPISKINSAALINIRMNNLCIDAHRHSRAGKYSKWNSDLDCIWDELAGDTKPDGVEEKKIGEIDNQISKNGGLVFKSASGFNKTSEDQLKTMEKQYKLLREKSKYLRRLMNKQGKGTAYDEEDMWE